MNNKPISTYLESGCSEYFLTNFRLKTAVKEIHLGSKQLSIWKIRIARTLEFIEWLLIEHQYFTCIKIHHCDLWIRNENMPCFIIYILYICIIEMQNLMSGYINNALALKGVYTEIYRIITTLFCYHIEVGNWGTCNIRQLFAS